MGETETLLIPPERLRALLIDDAQLGEKIMRAFIVRRVALIERGAGGPAIIGEPRSRDVVRLTTSCAARAIPYEVLDPVDDEAAEQCVVERCTPSASRASCRSSPAPTARSCATRRRPSSASASACWTSAARTASTT